MGAAWLQALLDVEAGLAWACARVGLIEQAAAEAIASACVADRFSVRDLGEASARGGNPVIPLVEQLRAAVGEPHASAVHHGATSQDILDTAAMLVARRALAPLLDDAAAAADAAAGLAAEHRGTPMIGRTLLQQALPTTFGCKAAGWMTGIDDACERLRDSVQDALAVQLGGPVGTLQAYEGQGPAVVAALAERLGLAAPVISWHADRVRPAALASGLGLLTGALAKPARDVVLLAQDEVGEAREQPAPGVGGSSAMPHKGNPVAAVAALACAARVPGLVATMHFAMAHEHERAAGAWHAEWETLGDLLRLTGSTAAWTREALERLEVDAARMAANLAAAGARIGAAAGPSPDVGDAVAIVERALDRRRSA